MNQYVALSDKKKNYHNDYMTEIYIEAFRVTLPKMSRTSNIFSRVR